MTTLREWVTTHKTRDTEWLDLPDLYIFVRLVYRYHAGVLVQSLDLANMTVEESKRGTGVLTAFAEEAEALADELGLYLYVESILEERFAKWWERKGYEMEDTSGWGACVNAWRAPKVKSLVDIHEDQDHEAAMEYLASMQEKRR